MKVDNGRIVRGEPIAVPIEDQPRSIPDLVHRTVTRSGARKAVSWKSADGWSSWTYAELWEQVSSVAVGLRRMGIGAGDQVVILSRSRPEWLTFDLALMGLGAVVCPVYPGDPPARMAVIAERVHARLLVVEDAKLLTRFRSAPASADLGIPALMVEDEAAGLSGVTTLAALGGAGPPSAEELGRWDETWSAVTRDQVATIVHTIAADGEPLGVVVAHENLLHSYHAIRQAIPLSEGDRALSVLPMSHMFERGAGIVVALGIGASVAFAERQIERWAADMAEVQPTMMATIPLFFERIEQHITHVVAGGPAYRRSLFGWAIGLGHDHYRNHLAGRADGPWLRARRWLAMRTVLAPIRNSFGGRLTFLMSGGAALPESTGLFFEALGIPILEGYGLTETAPILTANRPGAHRYGTVGTPVAGTELRIDPLSGEILARGPQIMLGYLERPAETARAVDAEGWLHTGDLGEFDEAGRLRITGRLKNLLVLATGKNVAPAPIERALEASPFIARAVLVGDDRDQTAALLEPDLHALRATFGVTDAASVPDADLVARSEVQAQMRGELERLTTDFAAYERPRKFAVLPRLLSAEAGELDTAGRPVRSAVLASFGELEAALLGHPRAEPDHASPGSVSASLVGAEPGTEPSPTPSG
jgi:long-chain acyl-CoA synthetase